MGIHRIRRNYLAGSYCRYLLIGFSTPQETADAQPQPFWRWGCWCSRRGQKHWQSVCVEACGDRPLASCYCGLVGCCNRNSSGSTASDDDPRLFVFAQHLSPGLTTFSFVDGVSFREYIYILQKKIRRLIASAVVGYPMACDGLGLDLMNQSGLPNCFKSALLPAGW